MSHFGEPSNFSGGDKFVALIDEEDKDFLRVEVPKLIAKLKRSLHEDDIKVFNHNVSSKVISVTVDGGNQPVFPEMPAVGMALMRVSCSSDGLQTLPREYYGIVRYRNLCPTLGETTSQLRIKQQKELADIWADSHVQKFSQLTKISLADLGTSYMKNPETFVSTIRDIVEWAYIVYLVEQYKGIDVVVVRDGRLEQHGVDNEFVKKLKAFFESRQAKVVGVIKSSKLLNGSNGISLMVIAEWIREVEKQFYFKVPYELMDYVHQHERVWNPDHVGGFTFGHRYVGKMFPNTFRPLDSMFSLEIPCYFDGNSQKINDIVAAIICNRSLLYGGSFAPTLEAHSKASISDHIREVVQDYLVQETKFRYPF